MTKCNSCLFKHKYTDSENNEIFYYCTHQYYRSLTEVAKYLPPKSLSYTYPYVNKNNECKLYVKEDLTK